MNRSEKSCCPVVGVVSIVLFAVCVLPGCSESTSNPTPKPNNQSTSGANPSPSSTDDAKPKQDAADLEMKNKLESLIEKLEEGASVVRVKAADDLGQLGPAAKEAIPSLIGTLDESNVKLRLSAIKALGMIGPVSKDVEPALAKALKDDEDEDVREAAQAALDKIKAGK